MSENFVDEAIAEYQKMATRRGDQTLYLHLFNLKIAIRILEKIKKNYISQSDIDDFAGYDISCLADILDSACTDGVGELIDVEFHIDSFLIKQTGE